MSATPERLPGDLKSVSSTGQKRERRTLLEGIPAIRDAEKIQHTLEFIFQAHLELFNIRRNHEWQVIIGAMVMLGAIDVTLISNELHLSILERMAWIAAIVLLFTSVWGYEMGVQKRNRVDRIAMNAALAYMCDSVQVEKDDVLRIGLDSHDESDFVHAFGSAQRRSRQSAQRRWLIKKIGGVDIDEMFAPDYYWAFRSQMTVLLVACLISGFVPFYVNGHPKDEKPAATAASFAPTPAAAASR